MSDDPEQATRRLKLKLALEDLREMKGFGTELVTVIIPPDRQVSDARQMLQNEHGQAANIKSKSTKKNVQGLLSQQFHHYQSTEMLEIEELPYSPVL